MTFEENRVQRFEYAFEKISTFFSRTLDKFQVDFALTDTSSEALSAPKIFLGRSRARIFHRLQNAYNKFSRGREHRAVFATLRFRTRTVSRLNNDH